MENGADDINPVQSPANHDGEVAWPPTPRVKSSTQAVASVRLLTGLPAFDFVLGFAITFGLMFLCFLGLFSALGIRVYMPNHKYLVRGSDLGLLVTAIGFVAFSLQYMVHNGYLKL